MTQAVDELTRLREEYETALDELESKRAAYRAAMAERVAEGINYSRVASETGLTDQAAVIQATIDPKAPRLVRWAARLNAFIKTRHRPQISWRRLAIGLPLLLLPLVAGLLLLYGPWTSFSMDMTIDLKEGATRADADRVVESLHSFGRFSEKSFVTRAEAPDRFTSRDQERRTHYLESFYPAGDDESRRSRLDAALQPGGRAHSSALLVLHFPMQEGDGSPLTSGWFWSPPEGVVVDYGIDNFSYDPGREARQIAGNVLVAMTPSICGILLLIQVVRSIRRRRNRSTTPAVSAA